MEQIPFANGSALIDTNDEINLLREIKDRFNVLINNHQEINVASLGRLIKWPHKFTINMTGCFWFLYAYNTGSLTDRQHRLALINRQTFKHYFIDANFSADIFDGTLISGEMINSYFIAEDLLIYRNQTRYYLDHDLDQRLAKLSFIFREMYTADDLIDPIRFVIRPYWPIDQLQRYDTLNGLVEKFGVRKYRQIIFTPLNFFKFPNSLIYNMKNHEIKITISRDSNDCVGVQSNTKKLTLRKHSDNSDVYEVFDATEVSQSNDVIGLAYVGTFDSSIELRKAFRDRSQVSFECVFNKQFKKWQPIKEA